MVKNIPTFDLKVSEGFISEDKDASRLFGFCIESVRGPILEPTYVSSNAEALRIFGCDFEPHFKQNPTGLLITRVSYPGMRKESLTYKIPESVLGVEKDILQIESITYGSRPRPISVRIIDSTLTEGAYDLTISIPEANILKVFKGVKDIFTIAKRIQNNYSDYINVNVKNVIQGYKMGNNLYKDIQKTEQIILSNGTYLVYDKSEGIFYKCVVSTSTTFTKIESLSLTPKEAGTYTLSNGSNGIVAIIDTEKKEAIGYNSIVRGYKSGTKFYFDEECTQEMSFDESCLCYDLATNAYYDCTVSSGSATFTSNTDIKEFDIDDGKVTEASVLKDSDIVIDGSYDTFAIDSSLDEDIQTLVRKTVDAVNKDAYETAFVQLESVDLVGCSVLTKSKLAHMQLLKHVEVMNDSEVNKIRFAVTANLSYNEDDSSYDIDKMASEAIDYNNEYIIYIGGAVKFQSDLQNQVVVLPPYKAVQFYTGLRSKLGYYESIFGGEPKKALKGVIDIIPLRTGSVVDLREILVELNEAGVCLFKKEYGEVTFIEGVTTSESEILSHEDIMSIVAYVSKALIEVCKPYQGQKLTEDLKTTLSVALSDKLKTIQETDKTLVAIEEYNIPPYDVEVSSAAIVKMNQNNQLVRESKIVVRCKIVPIGALRDIDLGVIVI